MPFKPLHPRTVKKRLRELTKELDGHVLRIREQMLAVRSRCPHKYKRLPDPAGGPADYVCVHCGLVK